MDNIKIRNVLVVVDMQWDFIFGALGSKQAQKIIQNVITKIKFARERGDLIIFTKDTHSENYLNTIEGKYLPIIHCIRGTKGWEIISELSPQDDDIIIFKDTFGSLYLANTIKKFIGEYRIGKIELCGVCTDICVVSNALLLKASFAEECEICVDEQCCAGTTPEKHKAAIATMESCHIQIIKVA